MKTPHLLRVDEAPESFASLAEAVRALGLRVGWLDLADPEAEPGALPEPLAGAAGLGVLRAVSVERGRTVAVKPLRGAAVLKDLLREHFQGCAVVLVRGGAPDAPALRKEDGFWVVTPPGLAARRYETADLALALRKPRPWGEPAAAGA